MLEQKIAEVLGKHGSSARRVMDYMKIADEVFSAHGFGPGKTHDHALHVNAFPGQFFGLSELVYRDHVAELCVRRAAKRDLAPGTRAEVMLALANDSMRAPLSRSGSALYQWLFRRIMPDAAKRVGIANDPDPVYQGQIEQDLEDARKKLRGKRTLGRTEA